MIDISEDRVWHVTFRPHVRHGEVELAKTVEQAMYLSNSVAGIQQIDEAPGCILVFTCVSLRAVNQLTALLREIDLN